MVTCRPSVLWSPWWLWQTVRERWLFWPHCSSWTRSNHSSLWFQTTFWKNPPSPLRDWVFCEGRWCVGWWCPCSSWVWRECCWLWTTGCSTPSCGHAARSGGRAALEQRRWRVSSWMIRALTAMAERELAGEWWTTVAVLSCHSATIRPIWLRAQQQLASWRISHWFYRPVRAKHKQTTLHFNSCLYWKIGSSVDNEWDSRLHVRSHGMVCQSVSARRQAWTAKAITDTVLTHIDTWKGNLLMFPYWTAVVSAWPF